MAVAVGAGPGTRPGPGGIDQRRGVAHAGIDQRRGVDRVSIDQRRAGIDQPGRIE